MIPCHSCDFIAGWGNNELQVYTASALRVQDGALEITANWDGSQFTSGRMRTFGLQPFQPNASYPHGIRISARLKLPQGLPFCCQAAGKKLRHEYSPMPVIHLLMTRLNHASEPNTTKAFCPSYTFICSNFKPEGLGGELAPCH